MSINSKCKLAVHILAYILALASVLLLILLVATGNVKGLEPVVFAALLAGAVGLIAKKEWGRKTVLGGCLLGIVSVVFHALPVSSGSAFASLFFIVFYILVIYIYQNDTVRQMYQVGFESPSWKILLIDDDKAFLKLTEKNFAQQGISILTAESGEQGLEVARNENPDMIILDVILPGMKGREVCEKLKEDSRTKDIPIVFLTIKDSPDDISAELEAGAVTHLTKPVEFGVLYSEIRKLLGS